MPTYDYFCEKCQHEFEDFRLIDDRHKPIEESCPACQEVNCIILLCKSPGIVDPYRIGVTKPKGDFIERMQEIKRKVGKHGKIDI